MIKVKFEFHDDNEIKKINSENILENIQDSIVKLYNNDKVISFSDCHMTIERNHKLMNRFIEENINFFEINYKSMTALETSLHWCARFCEEARKFNQQIKLNPNNAEKHKKYLEKITGAINSKIFVSMEALPPIIKNYKKYIQKINESQLEKNDPIERLKNSIKLGIENNTPQEIGIHQFNWIGHSMKILADIKDENSGVFSHNVKIFNKLNKKLNEGQKMFTRMKNILSTPSKVKDKKRLEEINKKIKDYKKSYTPEYIKNMAEILKACHAEINSIDRAKIKQRSKKPYTNKDVGYINSEWEKFNAEK